MKNKKRGFHTKNNKLILESPQSKIVFSLIVLAFAVLIAASITEIINYNIVRLSPSEKNMEYDGRGDQLVEVNLTTPTKLSKKQQELFKDLEKEEEEPQKSFFSRLKESLK